MDSKSHAIRSVIARLVTDKPVRKTPYQVKGVFMKQYPEEDVIPMLDGTYRERFLYPRVQVKILNEQIYIVGLSEGVDSILSLVKRLETLDFGNITFQVHDVDLEEHDDQFRPITKLIRYRFITPWVALNQTTGSRYRFLSNEERVSFLNRLLGQNIVFLSREMGLELEDNVYTKVSLSSLFPKPVDENNWGAFSGEFRANFVLPNYLGIGNGITRGYGTIFGLFNPEMFQYDEKSLRQASKDAKLESGPEAEPETDLEIDTPAESEVQAVSMDDVPRPRRRGERPQRTVRSRKVLSEEFDIEEVQPQGKKKTRRAEKPTDSDKEPSGDDDRFNRPEYHRKQHDL